MSKLPAGYTKLEYIESSGTQYIDTGVRVMPENYQQLKMSVTCEKIGQGSGASGWLVDGSNVANAYFYAGVYNGNYYYGCGTTDHNTGISSVVGKQTFTLDIPSAKFTVSNAVDMPISTEAVTASAPLYLFGFSYSPVRCYAEKIYSCQIYTSATLIRDFIPCKNASGAVGLYDTVEEQFYGNAGTGTFTAGPETPTEPDAPKTIRVEELSNDRIKITWDAVIDATGYKLYSNNVLLTDTTLTSYIVSTKMFSSYVFSVLAYNNVGDSNSTTTVYSTIPEDPYNYLVYDRTQADADALKQLIQRGYQSLTPMQLEEWNSIASKGAWNYTDANRVGATINYMRTLLAASGLDVSDIPVASVASNINTDIRNENVTQLQESIKQLQQLYETNPDIVIMTSGPNWKYTQANQLEENLHILYEEIKSYYIWPNAYDATCGGEYL